MKKNIFLLGIAVLIPVLIYILPIFNLEWVIYKLDVYSSFWLFSLLLSIALLLFFELFGDFKQWFCSIIKETQLYILITLLLVIIIAVLISFFWIEGGSRVEADESIYLTTAQNFYNNQIGILCAEGSFIEEGFACVINESIKPRALSYIYMLGMYIFGTDLYWVYNLHTFFLLLILPIFFFAIKAWTKDDILSILSTALLAFVPILLFLSRSASIEQFYVFMFVLSLLFLKWAYDKNTIRHWILLALTLAFFAQSRSEAVFCLFAFIGVMLWRQKFFDNSGKILNSKVAFFLLTLSFFSIPVLCTLSLGRNHNLQGGNNPVRGHLFENIAINFKIMALSALEPNGLLVFPFFPYFTWLVLFGLILLVILAIKHKTYRYIAIFILLLSPQYIILFDGVSADFNFSVQQRFILIVLPAMAFLGALFITVLTKQLRNNSVFNQRNICIVIIGAIVINTVLYKDSFEQNRKKDYSFILLPL